VTIWKVVHMFNSRERAYLDGAWRRAAGLPEEEPKPAKVPDLATLRKTQWCPEFERLMRNRLLMGAFRYGLMDKQDFSTYDLVAEAHKRLDKFTEGGNMEHLVDAANMLLLRFYHGRKNGEEFQAIDDGEHTPNI